MLVVGFPAGALQANCYLVAEAEGGPCVVIDPGQDAAAGVVEAAEQHSLTPAAVLLTHGHFDHCFAAHEVCTSYDVPLWIHPDDRHLLADPLAGLGREAAAFFGGNLEMTEPDDVRELADRAELELAGLRILVDHTPGHTGGSVVFRLRAPEGAELMFSGDTLFQGSIGRMDLPGGDATRMAVSLRDRVMPSDDDTVVLPGHGSRTTIGQERANNPLVREMLAGAGPMHQPSQRGL